MEAQLADGQREADLGQRVMTIHALAEWVPSSVGSENIAEVHVHRQFPACQYRALAREDFLYDPKPMPVGPERYIHILEMCKKTNKTHRLYRLERANHLSSRHHRDVRAWKEIS